MNDTMMQTSATAGSHALANEERRRAYSEFPQRQRRGLDTGARGWRYYDVQVLRAADNKTDNKSGLVPLQSVHSRQLGLVIQIAVIDTPEGRMLAALQGHDPDEPLNHGVFPEGTPQGAARGIHLFALVDGQWQPRDLLPLPVLGDSRDQTHDHTWDQSPKTFTTDLYSGRLC